MEREKCDIRLGEAYQREVRPMLELVSDLQQILQGHTQVPLPRIAVVGNQSSGKSSVLERLSSVQLPRASGLCTRVPLVLSMKSSDKQEAACRICYEGLKCKNIPLQKVSSEIEDATRHLAGDDNSIVDKSINLTVEASNVPELTLVDLPGIVYTAAKGQPCDIGLQVRSLILKHIRPKETLILCVFDGTTDIQASEALKLAREVDETGERTLGIITKIDRCEDKSSLSSKILQLGKDDMNIKLGLIAVRNRTVQELKNNPEAALEQVAETEQSFFESSPEFKNITSAYRGITALVTKLCNLQLDLLKKVLPGIGQSLLAEMRKGEKQLLQFKGCKTATESFDRMQRELDRLKLALRCVACGDYVLLDEMCECPLRLVPQMQKVLEEFTSELARRAPKVFESSREQEAAAALAETAGHGLSNFLSHEPFQGLMRKWHEPYNDVVMEAFDLVAELVRDNFVTLAEHVPSAPLREFFARRVEKALDKQDAAVKSHLELFLKMETRVIDTLNNYYITTLRYLEQFSENRSEEDGSSEIKEKRSKKELCALISDGNQNDDEASSFLDDLASREKSHDPQVQKLLKLQLSAFCYNKVVRKRIADQVMQILRYHYIEYARDELGFQLASGLTREQAYQLLRLGVEEESAHSKFEAMIEACRQGLERIDEAGAYGIVGFQRDSTTKMSGNLKKNELPSWTSLKPPCRQSKADGIDHRPEVSQNLDIGSKGVQESLNATGNANKRALMEEGDLQIKIKRRRKR